MQVPATIIPEHPSPSRAACSPAESRAAAAIGGSATHPVVVELFQIQGCSSCPPANANVNAIANRAQLDAVIATRGPARGGPEIASGDGHVRLSGPAKGIVWLVRYDPRIRQVPIAAGENGGRTLPHRDIVRQLVRLGDYASTSATWPLPPARARARRGGAGPAGHRRSDHCSAQAVGVPRATGRIARLR